MHRNLSLLFRVRIANVVMLIIAMYISAIFLFNRQQPILLTLKDIKLHGIVFSSGLSAMAGYIINFFYDTDKDKIYRPLTVKLNQFIGDGFALQLYLSFNIISLAISCFLSYRIFFFFLFYQFMIWFYSHKLSRILIINNLVNSGLMLFPFFALFLYYENYQPAILYLALFLFFLIFIRDILKDIYSIKYDHILGYNTIPNILGMKATKLILDLLFLILIPISLRLTFESLLYEIRLYYLLSCFLCLFLCFYIWFINKKMVTLLILLIKFWVFIGTISLLFINGQIFI